MDGEEEVVRLIEIIKEILLLIWFSASGFLGYFITLESINKNPTKDNPIVFIHGWKTQNLAHFPMKKYLEKKGFAVYMTNFGLQIGGITKLAKRLKEYINDRELNNVVLVGASLGAIVSLLYLQKLDGWKNVKKFISLGGPFKGTPTARIGFFSKAARQVLPGSNLIKSLSKEKIKNPEKIICLRAKHDEMVPSGSQLKGAKNIAIDVSGHVNLLSSPKTFHLIATHAS